MPSPDSHAHWQNVYATRRETEVSWFQATPSVSLDLIRSLGALPRLAIIDVGGGASRLVDALLEEGCTELTVLDVSEAALSAARARLGDRAAGVQWVTADVTRWEPQRQYDLWHDRAAFHFLTEAGDRAAYLERLSRALPPGAHAIIATFANDGPERCSGLPVVRYDAQALARTLGSRFALVATRREDHLTPMGTTQRFQYSVFRRS
jgi:ubiquinone/menaquinone biosynthesis C-methylase UbiE